MSGGGVWCFRILFNDDSGERKVWFRNTDTSLVGVNYYQTDLDREKGIRQIKAVGPVSIYRGMTALVRESL